MTFSNVLEAIVSFPAVLLDELLSLPSRVIQDEKEVLGHEIEQDNE